MGLNTATISIVLWEKTSPSNAIGKFSDMLADGEIVELGYIAKRDRVLFTNKRILMINVQGLTGKKVDFHTIPYSKSLLFLLKLLELLI